MWWLWIMPICFFVTMFFFMWKNFMAARQIGVSDEKV